MTKKLPLGLQDFRKIRLHDFKYVDKTRYLYEMAAAPSAYFLSRPRRFGKSLTLSTLAELFSGSRELFEGLWIADKWDWEKRYPVIHFSLKSLNYLQRGLEESLAERIGEIAQNYGVALAQTTATDRLRELIIALKERGKVAVLIDEYDAPIVDYLGRDMDQAICNRNHLKSFYTVLKDMDAHLHFVLLTGVSRFSKVGIFSGLNNLQDLTGDEQYATMLGYTQEELENNFEAEIADAAQRMGIGRGELLDKMQFWYNGYRFEENAPKVYNPVSINLFLKLKKFENFWFETGTPTFLINILQQEGLYDFSLQPVSELDINSFDIERLNPYGLLYQTGYLTIDRRDEDGIYYLRYPNYEVEYSMTAYLMEAFSGVRPGAGQNLALQMKRAFEADDLERVISLLKGLFAGIPYQLYESAPERFFHASIHLLFSLVGMRIQSEVCTSDGRADSVVETAKRVYILEYKLDESPETALSQIRDKAYFRPWFGRGKPVTGIGVSFSSEKRNIAGWKAAELIT